jgi:hypothetical protein
MFDFMLVRGAIALWEYACMYSHKHGRCTVSVHDTFMVYLFNSLYGCICDGSTRLPVRYQCGHGTSANIAEAYNICKKVAYMNSGVSVSPKFRGKILILYLFLKSQYRRSSLLN